MKPKNYWNIENAKNDEEKLSAITLALKDISLILSNGASLKDNFKGAFLEVEFPAANADVAIRHGLDFVPTNYICSGKDSSFHIYDGSSSADKTFIYLRASATGNARLFIF